MTLWVLGLNHQTAPVGLRERVAFDAAALPAALSSLRGLPDVSEVAVLSTCNRTELYAIAEDGQVLGTWLAAHAEGLDGYLYRHSDADAVRHLFRVATGLDSMVLGEPQILGQVKEAWVAARESGALGSGQFGHVATLYRQPDAARVPPQPVQHVANSALTSPDTQRAQPARSRAAVAGPRGHPQTGRRTRGTRARRTHQQPRVT
jgi:hypothetical protein